ncbi:MAG: restriction endonuclease [Ignavibacteriae bacterium]|nr:restriction endonuclease [Ignavibacteriota bacterium]
MDNKVISPPALLALKEALTCIYWYKDDLKSFISNSIKYKLLLDEFDWNKEYKRNIVNSLIEKMSKNQTIYQEDLLELIKNVVNINDFSHLEMLEDGIEKAKKAKNSINALKSYTDAHLQLYEDVKIIEERKKLSKEILEKTEGVRVKLIELKAQYFELLTSHDAQKRGYILENLLRNLFELFDLDPKSSFKCYGEQIDGAFRLDNTDYLLESKWVKNPIGSKDLDSFKEKIKRRLDNTLGLFISINGFSEEGVNTHSSGEKKIILMDGSDIMAILEERIDLRILIRRKKDSAVLRGNIYLKVNDILSEN